MKGGVSECVCVCCQICNGILVGGLFKAYPSSSPLTHCLLWAVGTFHVVVDTLSVAVWVQCVVYLAWPAEGAVCPHVLATCANQFVCVVLCCVVLMDSGFCLQTLTSFSLLHTLHSHPHPPLTLTPLTLTPSHPHTSHPPLLSFCQHLGASLVSTIPFP